jgi:hypothetical protein
MRGLALVLGLALVGCGDDSPAGEGGAVSGGGPASGGAPADGGGGPGGADSLSLVQAFAEKGFGAALGSFHVIDLASCCDEGKSCSGNNPTSPYGAFYVPPSPGQTVPEEQPGEDGTSNSFRLRPDEAVVYVGQTPPLAAYFGFTAYLVSRTYDGERRTPFASLGETLNNGVVEAATGAPFDAPIAVIVTADATTEDNARAALALAGIDAATIHTLVIDPAAGDLGLEADDSTYGVLFRYALPADAAAGAQYLAAIPGALYRLTPTEAGEPSFLSPEPPRTKSTAVEDADLATALDDLESVIRAAHPEVQAQSMIVSKGEPDPQACIDVGSGCAGDNRDTNYPATLPQPFFTDAGEFYMVIGVDHRSVGKVSYSNFSFYAIDHLVGITGVSDIDFAGSAVAWLPNEPLADELFAWKIARNCGGDTACTEIPVGSCPDGIPDSAIAAIAFRTYLEPVTNTAPDVDTLVPSRVLRFRP